MELVISGLIFSSELEGGTTWLSVIAMLGVAAGIFLFFRGFRMLQYKRLILNTPFSKIRSASMGLVEISGTPNGPQTIASPITGQPCYYYRARGWQFSDSGKGGSWAQVIDESLFVPFFVEDNTGRVLIHPQGAALDVHRSFYDEFRTASLGMGSPVPESLRDFVIQRGLLSGDKIRLEEEIIKPGFPLFVYGTLGENSGPSSWTAQPHESAARVSAGVGRSVSLNFSYKTSGSDMATRMIGAMLTRLPGSKSATVQVNTPLGQGAAAISDEAMEELHRRGIQSPAPIMSESMKVRSFGNGGNADSSGISAISKGSDLHGFRHDGGGRLYSSAVKFFHGLIGIQ